MPHVMRDGSGLQVLVARLLSFVTGVGGPSSMDRTPHAEWVVVNTRVATLHALARCLLHAQPAGTPLRDLIVGCAAAAGKVEALFEWLSRLSFDAAVLQSETADVKRDLRSPLLLSTSSLTLSHVLEPMCAALPHALAAACALLASDHAASLNSAAAAASHSYAPLFHLALMQLQHSLPHSADGAERQQPAALVSSVSSSGAPPEREFSCGPASQAASVPCATVRLGTTQREMRADSLCYVTALCSFVEAEGPWQDAHDLLLLQHIPTVLQRMIESASIPADVFIAAAARLLAASCQRVAQECPHASTTQASPTGAAAAGEKAEQTWACLAKALLPSVVACAEAAQLAACDEATADCVRAAASLVSVTSSAAAALHTAAAVLANSGVCWRTHLLAAADQLLSVLREAWPLALSQALDDASDSPAAPTSCASNMRTGASTPAKAGDTLTECVCMLAHALRCSNLDPAALQRLLAIQLAVWSAADARRSAGRSEVSAGLLGMAAVCLQSLRGMFKV